MVDLKLSAEQRADFRKREEAAVREPWRTMHTNAEMLACLDDLDTLSARIAELKQRPSREEFDAWRENAHGTAIEFEKRWNEERDRVATLTRQVEDARKALGFAVPVLKDAERGTVHGPVFKCAAFVAHRTAARVHAELSSASADTKPGEAG